MASYKAKKHEEMLSDESGRIAFAICLINSAALPYAMKQEWLDDLMHGKSVYIYDNISICKDGNYGCYYTIMRPCEFSNRYSYKVVHRFSHLYDEIYAQLEAQMWHQI